LFQNNFFEKPKLKTWLAGLGLGLVILGVGGTSAYIHSHQRRIYPNVYINDVNVGDLTHEQATALLTDRFSSPDPFLVELHMDDIMVASSSSELGLAYQLEPVISQAVAYAKTGTLPNQLSTLFKLQTQRQTFSLERSFDATQVETMVWELKKQVDLPSLEPQATLKTPGNKNTIAIFAGKPGRVLELEKNVGLVMGQANNDSVFVSAQVASTGAQLNEAELQKSQERAEKLVSKQLYFQHPDYDLTLSDQELIALLQLPEGISSSRLYDQLIQWQQQVTRDPQNAVFEHDPETLVVKSFVPSLNGLELNTSATSQQISAALVSLLAEDSPTTLTQDLQLSVKPPTIPLAATNTLGITEQIGFGESEYAHSIATRVHNVALTTTKINNIIVKPGEEFSFNKALGDVSAATGFKPAYIIKDGQTVLGDGGGVCQVSTTIFRALLDSGLKITKRRPHSYRVTYYELNQKPGFDATVYSGDVDLRFINDTKDAVLIHAVADTQNLYMKVVLYGTSDGRTTEIGEYKSSAVIPAPPPVFTIDQTLPPGSKKQVDWAASGIKTSFKNTIKDKSGQIISKDVYTSNYIPWSAKYLVGP